MKLTPISEIERVVYAAAAQLKPQERSFLVELTRKPSGFFEMIKFLFLSLFGHSRTAQARDILIDRFRHVENFKAVDPQGMGSSREWERVIQVVDTVVCEIRYQTQCLQLLDAIEKKKAVPDLFLIYPDPSAADALVDALDIGSPLDLDKQDIHVLGEALKRLLRRYPPLRKAPLQGSFQEVAASISSQQREITERIFSYLSYFNRASDLAPAWTAAFFGLSSSAQETIERIDAQNRIVEYFIQTGTLSK